MAKEVTLDEVKEIVGVQMDYGARVVKVSVTYMEYLLERAEQAVQTEKILAVNELEEDAQLSLIGEIYYEGGR